MYRLIAIYAHLHFLYPFLRERGGPFLLARLHLDLVWLASFEMYSFSHCVLFCISRWSPWTNSSNLSASWEPQLLPPFLHTQASRKSNFTCSPLYLPFKSLWFLCLISHSLEHGFTEVVRVRQTSYVVVKSSDAENPFTCCLSQWLLSLACLTTLPFLKPLPSVDPGTPSSPGSLSTFWPLFLLSS